MGVTKVPGYPTGYPTGVAPWQMPKWVVWVVRVVVNYTELNPIGIAVGNCRLFGKKYQKLQNLT